MSNRPKTLQVGVDAALPVRPSVRFLYPCIRKNLVGHFSRPSSIESWKVAPRVQTRVSKSSLMLALHSRMLVHAIEERQKLMVRAYFFLIVSVDLVQPELDVRDFAGDGVDSRIDPTGEVAHRFGGVDVLRARGGCGANVGSQGKGARGC
jgi:hypothetical protein